MTSKNQDKLRVIKNIVYHESAGGYVFCEEKEELFVALLKNKNGKYYIPKGHLKTNELPEKAASREIKEELTLRVEPQRIAKVGIVEYSFSKDDDNRNHKKRVHLYIFKLPNRLEIQPLKEEDYVEAGWFAARSAIQQLEYEKDTLKQAIEIYEGYKLISSHLEKIINRLRETINDNLVAIVDSGSISSGGYKPGWSDIDLLIVLKRLNLDTKLKIAREINALKNALDIDIGLNLISETEFKSPIFPDAVLAGKTLQALIELSKQPERLLYLKDKIKAFVPTKIQTKNFSLSNIGYFVLLNRRELTGVQILDSLKFKAIVGKQIRYALIIIKLALQYHCNAIYETKQDTLFAAKTYYSDFDFIPIENPLNQIQNWKLLNKRSELMKILDIMNDFIENFSSYIYSKIKNDE